MSQRPDSRDRGELAIEHTLLQLHTDVAWCNSGSICGSTCICIASCPICTPCYHPRRSWDEERTSLVSQIEALRKEARLYVASNKGAAGGLTGDGSGRSANGPGGADGEDAEESPAAKLAALKRSLDEAKENEVRSVRVCVSL